MDKELGRELEKREAEKRIQTPTLPPTHSYTGKTAERRSGKVRSQGGGPGRAPSARLRLPRDGADTTVDAAASRGSAHSAEDGVRWRPAPATAHRRSAPHTNA